jgi:hypothetical protein
MLWWRRLKEKVGWVSVGRREDCLKGRTAGDVPEMLNEISSSSLSPLRSRVLYTRTLGEMHPRVCVRMCVCVCGAFLFGFPFYVSSSCPLLSLPIRSCCVCFSSSCSPKIGDLCWVHYAPADIDNPFTHTHTQRKQTIPYL